MTEQKDVLAQCTTRDELWKIIAQNIACEADCRKWPNGCGCAMAAADAIMASRTPAEGAGPSADYWKRAYENCGSQAAAEIAQLREENKRLHARIETVITERLNVEYAFAMDAKRQVEKENVRLLALVERADKILQSTGLQATVQEAILKHPHYSGSVTSAYGFAGAAIKAIRAALSSTVREADRG
jgi:hypothetical protein